MHCKRGCWRILQHKRTAWIAPALCAVVFLIYLSFVTEYEPGRTLAVQECMCGRCKPEKSSTEWFQQRFNAMIEPMLVGKDQVIPNHVQNWWLRLQAKNNASHMPEVLEQVFKVIPTGNPYEEQDNRPCRACAVVGNSGNLNGSRFGEKIDSHTFIFRMNKAPISGFEDDVGSRTTHHFMYPESATNLPDGVHLVLIPFKLQDLKWITSALTTGEIRSTYMKVKNLIKADKDKVSVFGFGADSKGNWHHYWERNRYPGAFRKTGVHNADYESSLIKQLVQEGRLTYYK
ncbi:CMP-N-acetylneuraminate-beta-galactosamide-alpha-2,3-sialyltransferase 2-like isoform X3 [Ascaphus truei]|uniref:CMP-N-acetylneuraminate-beta-galactosamide- alpha-2,3-sialyltransferase 2-like isoform X3 n=1 Tax=Ascaphus truei TaxID=8439 RepID=UPI003F5AC78D